MKRSNNTPWCIMAILVLVALVLTRGAAAIAQAQGTGPLPFLPVTIDRIEWVSNGPYAAPVGASGDWVAYTQMNGGCGHCGSSTNPIYLRNVVDGRKLTIKASTVETEKFSGQFVAATNITLTNSLLLWQQPGKTDGDPTSFQAGDFDCTQCYYNPQTGQGGQWTNGNPPPQASDWDATIEQNYNPDPSQQQPDMIKVVQHSTGKLVVYAPVAPEVKGTLLYATVVAGDDKLVLTYAPEGLPGPTVVKFMWLIQPDPNFQKVWAKADQAVADRKAPRSWLWGPSPIFTGLEAYAEGANGKHIVQYYDKSRMEVNHPDGNANDPYYVTNGLLTTELIAGEIQVGDSETIQASVPCTIPVAGDPRKDNPLTPGYSTLVGVASLHGDHQAQNRIGQQVADAIDVNGVLSTDGAHSGLSKYAAFVPQTGHNVPDVFWNYMTGMQSTYGYDWTFVLGYPITEGYWTQMRVSGKDMPVLVQAFQRRVLTYVPDFPPEWRVQQGNVGQHYLEWRYTMNGIKP